MGIRESVTWGASSTCVRAEFEGKSIGILMGIWESVTWGGLGHGIWMVNLDGNL